MKTILCAAVLAACSSFGSERWFEKNLDGFVQYGGKMIYTVTDGVLEGTAVGSERNAFLCTPRNYRDFELEYEVWIDPRQNSGVQIRSYLHNGIVTGYQVELDPSHPNRTCDVYDEERRGWLHKEPNPEAGQAFKPDGWNHVKIRCEGARIRTWLNGIAIRDFIDDLTLEGFIGFQVHSTPVPGLAVKWRNVRFTELPRNIRKLTVSPEGELKTLESAGRFIRESRKTGERDLWEVEIKPGRYELSETFRLTEKDYDIVFIGSSGQTILTGGFRIADWKEEGGGVWSAEIPGLKEGTVWFEQLFVEGRRAARSRWPKFNPSWEMRVPRKDFFKPAAVYQVVTTNSEKKIYADMHLTHKPSDLDLLAGIPKEELRAAQLVMCTQWETVRRMILEYDPQTRELLTMGRPWKPWCIWSTNSLYYVENVRSAFTDKGDWFLSKKDGKVYYRPLDGQDMKKVFVEAPRNGLVQWVNLNGSRNITFRNLTFALADIPRTSENFERYPNLLAAMGTDDWQKPGPVQWEGELFVSSATGSFYGEHISECTIDGCVFRNTGLYAVLFRNNCMSNRIVNNLFTDLGLGGIRFGIDLPRQNREAATQRSAFNLVDNNEITQVGRYFHGGVAINLCNMVSDTRITHNFIHDSYYSAITVGRVLSYTGGETLRNEVGWNRIENLGQGFMDDMAGVYTLGTSFGTRIHHNVISRIDAVVYGGWGLYADEGSEGITFDSNLVYDTYDGAFHQHYGRNNTVSFNIFANGREDKLAATRMEPHLSFYFTNNIVRWDGKPDVFYRARAEKVNIFWDNNIWWNATGEPPKFRWQSWDQWRASGKDAHSLNIDPLFVDPDRNDFRFKSDDVCRRIGFAPWDYTQAGLRK